MTSAKRDRAAQAFIARPESLRIGQLAKNSGVNVQTIRFYEREGLLAPPARTASGYRIYAASDLERVRVIRICQKIGFTLKEVKMVLEPHHVLASRGGDSERKNAARDTMLATARQRLAQIDATLAELTQRRANMAALVAALADDAAICPRHPRG